MVGKTRLYQRTGSPLIQGATRGWRRMTPWIVAAAVVVVAMAVWVYLAYLR
jgi:type VI protein secretion system component VasF